MTGQLSLARESPRPAATIDQGTTSNESFAGDDGDCSSPDWPDPGA